MLASGTLPAVACESRMASLSVRAFTDLRRSSAQRMAAGPLALDATHRRWYAAGAAPGRFSRTTSASLSTPTPLVAGALAVGLAGGAWSSHSESRRAARTVSCNSGPSEATATDAAGMIDFAQVAKLPRPGTQAIGGITFTPDDKELLYLKGQYDSLKRQLYATNTSAGSTQELACTPPGTGDEENLSLEEKLRRERARIMTTGVTSFQIAGKDGSSGKVLIPMGGVLYTRDGAEADAPLNVLFDPKKSDLGVSGPVLDPKMSKDGSTVCFVWSEELYCMPSDGSAPPRALTSGARGTGVTHGLADFLAQEELDRYEGFWMSSDGKLVAYEEVDERMIPQYRIMHQGSNEVGDGAQEDHRYPFAGKGNPKVVFHVVASGGGDDAAGPSPMTFDLTGPFGEDFYLGRVNWMPDGSLIVQVLSRDQCSLAVLCLDVKTGGMKTLFTEKSDVWINVHDMLMPIGKSGKFLWASERSGFRHLYTTDTSGEAELKQITSGDWQVEEVVALDDKNGLVYFMGTSEGSWLDRHLFSVPLDGRAKPKQITTEPGIHAVVVDNGCKRFVDVMSNMETPAVATLRELESGKELFCIFRNEDPRLKELNLPAPELATLPSSDGKVTLQAALYKPDPSVHGPGPYPTVVSCYGGPHVQYVLNSWARMTADLEAQMLREKGILVLKLDNRGSSRRGLQFEAPVKNCMGTVEVDDQVAGVKWAVEKGLADPARVGIKGWSYGGYLSAMCLVKAPDVFKCAISGAPVTDWDGYDTCYTERYMGTPESNPDGYKEGAVMTHLDGLKGDLLLVHGLIDENVHFRHTARLINGLIAAQKPYQLLLFPNERHSPRSEKDRIYMEQRIFDFIKTSLA
mmetsp:Transcript_18917/g.44001  ORF Transcript_18917/g.44001 Transcript_18917/m.44001 type:complete len:857 (+) Transcript_18917:78-2648(+)